MVGIYMYGIYIVAVNMGHHINTDEEQQQSGEEARSEDKGQLCSVI